MSVRSLAIRPIDRAGFAPYGALIDAATATGPAFGRRLINDDTSERIDGLSPLEMSATGGRPGLAVFRAQARNPAGPWTVVERHRLSSQTFIPLAGARSVVLVALGNPADPARMPDESTLAAFLVGGHQAFTLAPGVWHHGLIALDDGDFIVLERLTDVVDCDVATLSRPVRLG